MGNNQDDFLRELLNDFKIEADEHLQSVVQGLLSLEKDAHIIDYQSVVENIFRSMHSMKGAARAVNLPDIEQLCMAMESVFQAMKKEKLQLTPAHFDCCYKVTDRLSTMVKELDSPHKTTSRNDINKLIALLALVTREERTPDSTPHSTPDSTPDSASDIVPDSAPDIPPSGAPEGTPDGTPEGTPIGTSGLHREQEDILTNGPPVQAQVTSTSLDQQETVRVSTEKLLAMLKQAEEMVIIKSALSFQVSQLQHLALSFSSHKKKLEEFMHARQAEDNRCLDMIARDSAFNKAYITGIHQLTKGLEQIQKQAARAVEELTIDIKETLMRPFSSLIKMAPKLARDLAREHNKEVRVVLTGGEIDIDRRILEAMKDPLIHIIRNCIDHGIETPAERMKKGKAAEGRLEVRVEHDLNQKVKLSISDDGTGIHQGKLLQAAIKAGVIHQSDIATMTDDDIHMLIFRSGLTTSQIITDVSGRGLGMAIVAEHVEKIGGSIMVHANEGTGTTFEFSLPRTLATFRGILVKVSGHHFILPTTAILKAIRIKPQDIQTVESNKTILFNKETISLIYLADLLGITRRGQNHTGTGLPVFVLQLSQKKLALLVDEVLGEHEGSVKGLGHQLKHIKNIAGASMLGDGRIIPVLQVTELFESASRQGFADRQADTATTTDKSTGQIKVLVAEDSITVRNMLRNYLETAGFSVTTAVDGLEALGRFQGNKFDIVVSDVEMPRMNGFELTTRIKQDPALSDTPVILVTALGSADDRQRGLEAGANAYIVKSSFEKSNLIDTINRLTG